MDAKTREYARLRQDIKECVQVIASPHSSEELVAYYRKVLEEKKRELAKWMR